MKRKVIKLAEKTFVVSLPTTWTKEWNIKKGEEIDLTENGACLTITTQKSKAIKKGYTDIGQATDRVIRWVLSSLHKKGYDEIEIKIPVKEHIQIIEELLKDLFIGFAIVHQTDTGCTIKAVSQELDDQFDIILRRAFIITLNLAEQTHTILQHKKYDEIEQTIQLEKTNNQLTNFCQRILNKKGYKESNKTNFIYVITWNLEKIADEYKYILENIKENEEQNETAIDILQKTNALLRKYYELFYKFDTQRLVNLCEEYKKLQTDIKKELQKNNAPVLLSHLSSITTKIADFSTSIYAIHD